METVLNGFRFKTYRRNTALKRGENETRTLMPTINLTDNVGFDVNAELNQDGALAKYLKGLLNIQRELFRNGVLQVGYVDSNGRCSCVPRSSTFSITQTSPHLCCRVFQLMPASMALIRRPDGDRDSCRSRLRLTSVSATHFSGVAAREIFN